MTQKSIAIIYLILLLLIGDSNGDTTLILTKRAGKKDKSLQILTIIRNIYLSY